MVEFYATYIFHTLVFPYTLLSLATVIQYPAGYGRNVDNDYFHFLSNS